MFGHRCFSVKKVRILSADRAANCSINNSAVSWRKNPIQRILQNEKMEAPSIIKSIRNKKNQVSFDKKSSAVEITLVVDICCALKEVRK